MNSSVHFVQWLHNDKIGQNMDFEFLVSGANWFLGVNFSKFPYKETSDLSGTAQNVHNNKPLMTTCGLFGPD